MSYHSVEVEAVKAERIGREDIDHPGPERYFEIVTEVVVMEERIGLAAESYHLYCNHLEVDIHVLPGSPAGPDNIERRSFL